MKPLITLLLASLLCVTALAGEKTFPDNYPPSSGKYGLKGQSEILNSSSESLTFRLLLDRYSTTKGAAVNRLWKQNPSVAAATLAGLKQLAADATKAGDPKAAIYTRALDKLTQQMTEAGVRADAQSAVADALKALDKKE